MQAYCVTPWRIFAFGPLVALALVLHQPIGRAAESEKPRIVSRWNHSAKGMPPGVITFWSNGHVNGPNSDITWNLNGNKLTLRWKSLGAVDHCIMATDGRSYRGKSDAGLEIVGRLVQDEAKPAHASKPSPPPSSGPIHWEADLDFKQGMAQRKAGDLDAAIASFTKLIKKYPARPIPLIKRGVSYLDNNDLDNAIADFTRIMQLPGHSGTSLTYIALCFRARSYYQRGDLGKALDDAKSAFDSGRTYFAKVTGQNEKIRKENEESFKKDEAEALVIGGMVCYERDQLDKALIFLNQALKANPNNIAGLLTRGHVHYERDEGEKAITDFTAVLKLKPKNGEALRPWPRLL